MQINKFILVIIVLGSLYYYFVKNDRVFSEHERIQVCYTADDYVSKHNELRIELVSLAKKKDLEKLKKFSKHRKLIEEMKKKEESGRINFREECDKIDIILNDLYS